MLTKEELQNIIDQFDEEKLKKLGIFGISQYGGGSDESFLRANKEGLELFAIQLLKSARDTEDILSDKEKNIIPLDYNEDWIDENSDTFIQYIEPITDKQKLKDKNDYKTTFADKLIPYGCGLILIILAIATIVGLVTICNWIF
ncbi:hypothetical protein K5I29_02445 [Flavobacterium agricola]|uniref:Uncharacterized protein n=1 Tax=Flavobacterium agricola TaxID=2870839 RepID=A0ABY6LZS7_9FLAO|nr:hypothetical protein [Flavobacterium agricola]UYW01804.1 hypothetical protein K5I29_02445 [Flavobacterium agricola]